jgi:excisionase family DNA binding protein
VSVVAAENEHQTPEPHDKNEIAIEGRASPELVHQIAVGSLRGAVAFLKARLESAAGIDRSTPAAPPLAATETDKEVMTADEVAAFLGVDRNTVYDYAGRGVIPHQRLGKRILFRRGALVSWLDESCKATSTRKG